MLILRPIMCDIVDTAWNKQAVSFITIASLPYFILLSYGMKKTHVQLNVALY